MTLNLLKHLSIVAAAILMQIGCGDGETGLDDTGGTDPSATDSNESSDKGNTPIQTNCNDVSSNSGNMNTQYAKQLLQIEGSDKTYMLHTNWWYQYDGQTVTYDGLSLTVNNPNDLKVPPTDGKPLGYPSYYIGSYGGLTTVGSNLPMKVSEIQSAPTSFHTNVSSIGYSNTNAAYDVWLTKSGSPLPSSQYDPGKGGAYLMVWLFMPSDRQPRGRNEHPSHTVEGVEGEWNVWVDHTDPTCISYVATQPMDGLDFDLNAFIRDSVDNNFGLTDDMYLSIVFAGFEIWGGADGIKIEKFCAEVN